MFVYKHAEAYFLKNIQTLQVKNSRILRIQNAKFSYYFCINTNKWRDFQICISVHSIIRYCQKGIPSCNFKVLKHESKQGVEIEK